MLTCRDDSGVKFLEPGGFVNSDHAGEIVARQLYMSLMSSWYTAVGRGLGLLFRNGCLQKSVLGIHYEQHSGSGFEIR